MLLKSFFKWSLLSACLVWSAPVYALTIPVGDLIANGVFQTNTGAVSLSGWTGTGTFNGRASTNDINTTVGNAGFNSFFNSAFAALGDTSAAIGGTPNAGTHSLSQTFELQAILDDLAI